MNDTHATGTGRAGAGCALDLEAGRRAFMKAAGLTGAIAAFAGATGAPQARAQAPSSSDVDTAILNLALTLEYLEGEYYGRGVYGRGLASDLTVRRGHARGADCGSKVDVRDPAVLDAMADIADDEEDHATFLRSALGRAAAARPAVSLDAAFTAFAAASGLPIDFSPYADRDSFLLGARILTEVWITAYDAAAPSITSKAVLAAASSIRAAEADHLDTIRALLFRAPEQPCDEVPARIAAARSRLSRTASGGGIGGHRSQRAGGFPSPADVPRTHAGASPGRAGPGRC